jgi:hypothetical protein
MKKKIVTCELHEPSGKTRSVLVELETPPLKPLRLDVVLTKAGSAGLSVRMPTVHLPSRERLTNRERK